MGRLCHLSLDMINPLLQNVEDVLDCNKGCATACHSCLKHYWNQRVHKRLDRFAALDLLKWGRYGDLPKPITTDEQSKIITPLIRLLIDAHPEIQSHHDQTSISISLLKTSIKLVVHPAMWAIPTRNDGALYISDKQIINALPKAFDAADKHIKTHFGEFSIYWICLRDAKLFYRASTPPIPPCNIPKKLSTILPEDVYSLFTNHPCCCLSGVTRLWSLFSTPLTFSKNFVHCSRQNVVCHLFSFAFIDEFRQGLN